jgi:hypothetical protein
MTFRILLSAVFFGAASLVAQVATPPGQVAIPPGQAAKVTASLSARDEATESCKNGNAQSAIGKLQGAVKQGQGAPPKDVQVAGELSVIARNLAAAQHSSAQSTAVLAAGELAKARAKTNGREAAALDLQAGELQESLLGDRAKARQFYQAALAQDYRLKEAEAGLKRIARAEALALAKAKENAELRNRVK